MLSFKEYLAEVSQRIPGKSISGAIYVHKDYVENHPKIPQSEYQRAKSKLPTDHDFTAVKYDKNEGSFSFIHSPDFDTADEPTVGRAIKVKPSGDIKVTEPTKDPKIWHHKWQWVADDYKGFDVNQSKQRSKDWKDVVGVDRQVSSRIGSKSYWEREIVPKIKKVNS